MVKLSEEKKNKKLKHKYGYTYNVVGTLHTVFDHR